MGQCRDFHGNPGISLYVLQISENRGRGFKVLSVEAHIWVRNPWRLFVSTPGSSVTLNGSCQEDTCTCIYMYMYMYMYILYSGKLSWVKTFPKLMNSNISWKKLSH